MKTKFTLVYPESGDWEALYINGKLVAEGHSLSVQDVLDCIDNILPNEYKYITISDETAELGMPQYISELDEVLEV